MAVAIVTGSGGLVGSATATKFAERGMHLVGIDNDLRRYFFGDKASTQPNLQTLMAKLGGAYTHYDIDIRSSSDIGRIFRRFGGDIDVVIHTAAQPSHDWASREPETDFSTNAMATLFLLESTRQHCPEATFIFTSTNKVYGDTVNRLPMIEHPTRWELSPEHAWAKGVTEEMSVDQSLHSLFGASKLAADLLVQEYGRYFDMRTACFRAGCITGPSHAGAELHGFLAYLIKSVADDSEYHIFGYKGKQVRDNIHAWDLVNAFEYFCDDPEPGAVYNIGGGRESNCSLLEALSLAQEITQKEARVKYSSQARIGDHIWWISGMDKFRDRYPEWKLTYDVPRILQEIYDAHTAPRSDVGP